jgi:hypothetical protein
MRHSPRPEAVPSSLGLDSCTLRCHNLVTRSTGSDVFFSNLAFAYAVVEGKKVTTKDKKTNSYFGEIIVRIQDEA